MINLVVGIFCMITIIVLAITYTTSLNKHIHMYLIFFNIFFAITNLSVYFGIV